METRPSGSVRVIAVVLVVLTGVTTAATVVLIVFGAPLGEAIATQGAPRLRVDVSWAILRWPVTLTALLTFFALVYYLAPNIEARSWKWITPGAVVGRCSGSRCRRCSRST